MTRFQTFIFAVIAGALSIMAGYTVFQSNEARADFKGQNLIPIIGDMAGVLFYNDGDHCIYDFKMKSNGTAKKIACITNIN